MANWTPAQFERSYAPGKWSARRILIHLTQTELALGNRARMALATPGYTAQAFDQDQWMAAEGSVGRVRQGRERCRCRTGARRDERVQSRAVWISIRNERATPFTHPEYGALTVDWVIHQMAGHLLHHLAQLETIAKQ